MNRRTLQCLRLAASVLLAVNGLCFAVAAADSLPGVAWSAGDSQRSVQFVTPAPHFALTEKQSLHPQLRPEFSARCEGLLKVPQDGAYTIHSPVPVWIDGVEVANRRVTLRAGELPLRFDFRRAAGSVRVQLLWESDDFAVEPIPDRAFAHRENPPGAAAHEKRIRGRELIEEFGCVSCHPTSNPLLAPRGAPDLSNVGSRLQAAWVFHWLRNPAHVRSDAAMPTLLRNDQECADVAAFLGTLREPKAPAANGKQNGSPAPTAEAGAQLFTRAGCAACHGEAGVPLDGTASKFQNGALTLYLKSPLEHRAGTRMPDLALSTAEAESIALFLADRRNPALEQPVSPGDAGRGRDLAVARGCAACHTLRENGTAMAHRFTAPALESLAPERGCLADAPGSAPRFAFADGNREAVRAFLASPDVSEAPLADVPRLVARFRCQACHEFHGSALYDAGGSQPPPSLSGIGGKLRPEWLEQVLHERKRARPWFEQRMPHYGAGTLAALVRGFPAVAGAEVPSAEPPASFVQTRAGAQLIGAGEGGLSCVTCHDCLGERSIGELRGPDLSSALRRSRGDWVRRWLRDPQRIAPGTAMPAFFGAIPAAEREEKISNLLAALAAGPNMPPPAGLRETTADYLLSVGDTPLVFRCFLVGSSARSIAVGLPGGLSYCFDAESCRLRFAWSGEFLNMKPVWAGRGGMPPEPRGAKFFTAPDMFPIRIGAAAAPKFRGHAIVRGVPEFYFDLGPAAVTQRIAVGEGGLISIFELRGAGAGLSCLAMPGTRVRAAGKFPAPEQGGWTRIPAEAEGRFEILISGPDNTGPVKTASNNPSTHK